MVHELVWAQLPHEASLHGRAGPGITLSPSLTLPAGKGRAAWFLFCLPLHSYLPGCSQDLCVSNRHR